jgi:hypothetical protein
MGPRDVTVTNPNGQSGVRPGGFTIAPPPATISLAFLGKLRDKVGPGAAAFSKLPREAATLFLRQHHQHLLHGRSLTAQVTLVKAVHIVELRTPIGSLPSRNGLPAFTWTDPTLAASTTPIKAVHILELGPR